MTSFWQEVLARPREVFARLSRGQRIGVLALASVGIVVAVLASLLAGRESFVLLYGGLEPAEAQEVCAKLGELGVPYRLSADGSMVQVPEERVAESKMQLASARLPHLGSPGFELFDESQLGLTDALFNVNLQRAIQGAIENSIESCGPVKQARVLITLPPAASAYRRDSARATASVSLTLRGGMPLADSEVAAIAHLVAASAGHGMRVGDVTITDQDLRLLHPRGDANDPLLSAQYLQKVQDQERYLQEKAESQLRAAFGEGKASVRVSVELDLTHRETAKETLEEDNKVPVKEVTSSDVASGAGISGGDPSVTQAGKGGKEPGEAVLRQDQEKEYQIGSDRTLEIKGAGSIRRLSVSVLLDDSDPAIKAKSAELEELVKNSVGFSKERKDTFQIAFATFAKPPAAEPPPGPFALENLLPLAGHLAEGVTVIFVLVLIARVLRAPAAAPKSKSKAGAGVAVALAGVGAGGDERDEEDIMDLEMGEAKGADLRHRVGRFVNRHPDQAREVLVAWLKEELTS